MQQRAAGGRGTIVVVYKQAPVPSRRIPAHAARAHLRTLEHLYRALERRHLPFRAIPIDQLGPLRRTPLVITVGGDGTVLATSHFVTAQPVLGVKSFGETSVGHFCAATADTLDDDLDAIHAGRWRARALARLCVTVDGRRLEELVLNDCLFAHASPAAITDYRLAIGRRSEVQRSSGIWVSTAAGSTAAISGAGGRPMPLASTRIQYLIREPYAADRAYRLLGGILPPQAAIWIESLTVHGTLSIDGAHIQYPVSEGSVVTIRRARQPFRIYWR